MDKAVIEFNEYRTRMNETYPSKRQFGDQEIV